MFIIYDYMFIIYDLYYMFYDLFIFYSKGYIHFLYMLDTQLIYKSPNNNNN